MPNAPERSDAVERATVTVDGVTEWLAATPHRGTCNLLTRIPFTKEARVKRDATGCTCGLDSVRAFVAALESDLAAVRRVEQWRKTVGRVVIANAFRWEAIDGLPHIEADSVYSLGRALIARQQHQEEGNKDG
jgi:hypothetical protein